MKFFRLIRQHIDVIPLQKEVESQDDAWFVNTSRQDKISVQRDTQTIFLRDAVRRPDLNVNENQESSTTRISSRFPAALRFLTHVAADMDCILSRAVIVRLKPLSSVRAHIDGGSYYLIRDRYHMVLKSRSGSVLRSGNEEVKMAEGELWWFNNKQYHSSYNNSNEWRIHYIFDLLPRSHVDLAVNPLPPQIDP